MKITFVLPVLDLTGGCRVVSVYAQLLQERGHDVCVVVPRTRRRTIKGVVRDVLRSGRLFARQPRIATSHFKGSTTDVRIVSWTSASQGRAFPDADVLIATWWETMEWVDVAPRRCGAKAYFIQHHETFDCLPLDRVRATYRMKAARITIARWIAELLASEYHADCVAIIPNAVDQSVFNAAHRERQSRPTLGFVYSPIKFKGAEVALEAIRSMKADDARLRVIAFGAEPPNVPLPEYIEFHHRPAQSTIPELYRSCDVWLCPSHSEGFNLPAMEAMACGTPVVSTRTGWPAEAIHHGVNGYLVDVNDANMMRSMIQKAFQTSSAEWSNMSAAAQATAHAQTWEKSVGLFEESLLQIVAEAA